MLKSLLFISLFAFSYATASSAQSLSEFRCELFPGKWRMETGMGALVEEWKMINPSHCQGKSYTVQNGDTTMLESMQLKIVNNSLVYAPTVTNQNDGKEILFFLNPESSKIKTGFFVFENAAHDFPQRIIYHWADKETLNARVEGTVNGKLEFSDYH